MKLAAIVIALTGSILIALLLTAVVVDTLSSILYHGGIAR